jgi:hypothetical protein
MARRQRLESLPPPPHERGDTCPESIDVYFPRLGIRIARRGASLPADSVWRGSEACRTTVPVSQIDDFEHGARVAVWVMVSLMSVFLSLTWCVATSVLFYPFGGYDGDRGCVKIDQQRYDWSEAAWRMSILFGFFPFGLLMAGCCAWIFTYARAWPAYLRFILHSLRHTRVWYGAVLVAAVGLVFLERFADAGLLGGITVFAVFAFTLADTLSLMPRVPGHFFVSIRITVILIAAGSLLRWIVFGLEQSLCDRVVGRNPETVFDQMVISATQSALSLQGAKYMRRCYVKLRNPRGPSYDLPSTEGLQGPWGYGKGDDKGRAADRQLDEFAGGSNHQADDDAAVERRKNSGDCESRENADRDPNTRDSTFTHHDPTAI